MQVIGRMPNLEKLERLNLVGLKASFVLMTFGLASGIGLAAVGSTRLEITFEQWMTDPKLILFAAVWIMIGSILASRHIFNIKSKAIAYITVIAFVLIVFALVGTTVFCGTKHDFKKDTAETAQIIRQI